VSCVCEILKKVLCSEVLKGRGCSGAPHLTSMRRNPFIRPSSKVPVESITRPSGFDLQIELCNFQHLTLFARPCIGMCSCIWVNYPVIAFYTDDADYLGCNVGTVGML
jgi:hypothetical protein